MINLALQIFKTRGGDLLANLANAEEIEITNGEHGFKSLTCFVPLNINESFIAYNSYQAAHVSLNYGGGVAWEGRIEDVEIVDGGLSITALGYWQALSDAPYTALWSDTSTAEWRTVTTDLNTAYSPGRYSMDTNNRLYLAPRAGENFGSSHRGADFGGFYYQIPDESTRNITVIQFDYELTASTNWRIQFGSRDADFTGFTNLWNHIPSGSAETGAHFITFTGKPIIQFLMFLNAASETITGDTGDVFAKITNLRVATSTTNKVDTTATHTVAIGSAVISPVSMSNIYVGQRLVIAAGGSSSESVLVTAITSTTFTATFAKAHTGTFSIKGIVVYADEIAADIVSEVNTLNSSQLSNSVLKIESPGLDLHDRIYEDDFPSEILTSLADLGDNQTPPNRWEVGIWEDQTLYFRPRGTSGRAWSIHANRLFLNGTLNNLVNSVYSVYKDPNGNKLRTNTADDSTSVAKYGLTRRRAISIKTTQANEAETFRDTALEDGATPAPRGEFSIDLLTGVGGEVWPKWAARAGDTMTIRALSPSQGNIVDKVRTFILAEVNYSVTNDILSPTPENKQASLEFLISRQKEGF